MGTLSEFRSLSSQNEFEAHGHHQNEFKSLEHHQSWNHVLRVQRSLNNLDLPEWYTAYTSRTTTDSKGEGVWSTSTPKMSKRLAGGWSGLSTSRTSLMSLQLPEKAGGRKNHLSIFQPPRSINNGVIMMSSRDSLFSPSNTLSPSPSSFYSGAFTYGRFRTTSLGNPASPAPSSIDTGISCPVSPIPVSPNRYSSNSQMAPAPYMGWRRSQDQLSVSKKGHYYLRPPAERLAGNSAKCVSVAPSYKKVYYSLPSRFEPRAETEEDGAKKDDLKTCSATSSRDKNEDDWNAIILKNDPQLSSSVKEKEEGAPEKSIDGNENEEKTIDENGNVLSSSKCVSTSKKQGCLWYETSFVGRRPPGSIDNLNQDTTAF